MIVKDGTNPKIEALKNKLGITGDVYIVGEGNYIENLEGHKTLIPDSKAKTIEEAEIERLEFIEAERLRMIEEAKLLAEQGDEHDESIDDIDG